MKQHCVKILFIPSVQLLSQHIKVFGCANLL